MSEVTESAYYVCVYLKDGKPIGHIGALAKNFPESFNDPSHEDARSKKRTAMTDISDQFNHTMLGYLEYVPIILDMASVVSDRMVTDSIQEFLESTCIANERYANQIIYHIKLEDFEAFRRLDESLSAAASTSRSLPRLLTVGIVTSLEYHLNLLMKEIATTRPSSVFGKDRTISIAHALKAASIEELKDTLINEEIDRAQRESFEEQVAWIISKAEMEDFTTKYGEWNEVLELFERRNLFIHANGIVNGHYLKAKEKHKFQTTENVVLGKELHVGSKYYRASVHRIFHFGTMLMQVVWRKLKPDETEAADHSISDLGYELIARGQYELAVRILEFAKDLRNVSDEARKRLNVVNLANAYKLSGDKDKSLSTLSSMDWTAVSLEYKISVAAIKDEIDHVIELMKQIGANGTPSAAEYREWPVFYGIREREEFQHTFRYIFGVEYLPSAKEQAGLGQVFQWIRKKGSPKGTPLGQSNSEGRITKH